MEVWHYISHHWFQLTVDTMAALNVIASGTRVMGWNKLSDELGKVELAITTMVQAALNRNQIANNLNKSTPDATIAPITTISTDISTKVS